MMQFARVTLLFVAATFLSSAVKAQDTYSPRCNATLSLFNADSAVTSCLIIQTLFINARNAYMEAGNNFTATQHNVDAACGPTSQAAACTPSVLLRVQAGLNSDCASEILHANSSSVLYQLRLSVNFAALYQQLLCTREGGTYCFADFLQTYVKWPTAYDTILAAKIGVLGPAVGNISSTLSNELSFIACSSCSTKEYSAVFAVISNVLRHSPTISMTNVGLPGPNGSDPSEKASLGYIDFMNTTMSKQCGRAFLNYTVEVPPPSSSASSAPRTTNRSGSKSGLGTSDIAKATQSIDASNATNVTAMVKSAAIGLQSSVWGIVLAGGIASLAALLL